MSLVVLLATAVRAGSWWCVTGSVALLADTIHNFSDALTAVPLWIAFVLGRRAASRRYTYGYGRAEDLAGVFIVAMIALSAVVAGYESVRRLLEPAAGQRPRGGHRGRADRVRRQRSRRDVPDPGRAADRIGGAGRRRPARADRRLTSLAVVVGAVGVLAGFPLADPIVGLLITVAILVVLKGAATDIYRRLMDAVDPTLVDTAEASLRAVPGVLDVEELRLRWIGHRLRAEVGVVVDARLSVIAAHDVATAAHHRLLHDVPKLIEATVHVSPSVHDGADHHAEIAHHAAALDPGAITRQPVDT